MHPNRTDFPSDSAFNTCVCVQAEALRTATARKSAAEQARQSSDASDPLTWHSLSTVAQQSPIVGRLVGNFSPKLQLYPY